MKSIRPENKKTDAREYISSARERLRSSKILLDAESYGDSVSRSFYAFLDAATAALITKDLMPRSHAGVIDLFSLHFIKPEIVEKKYIRWFKGIKKNREEADYRHKRRFSKEEAQEALEEAGEFVGVIEKLLPGLLKE